MIRNYSLRYKTSEDLFFISRCNLCVVNMHIQSHLYIIDMIYLDRGIMNRLMFTVIYGVDISTERSCN